MSIMIRKIEQKDNKQLAELIRAVFREFKIDQPGTVYTDPRTDHLFEFFQHPLSACWLAEEDGQLLGSCGVYPTEGLPDGCAEFSKFYLKSDARGKGLGRLLMDRSFESAALLGYQHLYLESFPELNKAVGIYEKAGFKPIPTSLGNSGHTACTIWMLKDLSI